MTGDIASGIVGFGDGASFGLTGQITNAIAPGADCILRANPSYYGGLGLGAVATTVVTAGIGAEGDVADAGEFAEDGASDLESATSDTSEDSSALCGGESFTAGTFVVLASGKVEPIASIRVGDRVKAVDTSTGKSVTRKVTALWVNHDTDLMDVTVTNAAGVSSTIHSTAHHLFWDLTSHTWVEADQLRTGDRLDTDNGAAVTFTSSTVVPGAADMWDLTIAGTHDFYITTGDNTVLVHNNDCYYRMGDQAESAAELGSKAAEAQAKGFPHGVSVLKMSTEPLQPAGGASREAIEESFNLLKTGSKPNHFTVELPNPVTDEVANTFNSIFGR